MAQFARPDADIDNTFAWDDQASSSVNVFQALDEVTRDDADWVKSPTAPLDTEVLILGLSDVTDPAASTGHVFRYTFAKNASAGQSTDLHIALYQGTTEIVAWTEVDPATIAPSFALSERTLTGPQADAITDYTDLRVRLWGTVTGGGAGRSVRISWIEFEVPDAAGPPPPAVPVPAGTFDPVLVPEAWF